MTENVSTARTASGSAVRFFPLLLLVPLYYALLLLFAAAVTTGTTSLFAPVETGMAFNSMLAHLLRGEFDVDPAAIGLEAFVRNGKTYAYFGVFAALLRLPLLLFGDLGRTDVTILSCLVAAVVIAAAQLAAILIVWRAVPPSALRRLLAGTLVVATLLSGPQIAFLRPSIYQEVVLWANASAAAFVCCAVYGIVRGRFGTGLLTGMAVLAGLCLHTRVSTAIGLYAATGLLLARSTWLRSRDGQTRQHGMLGLLVPAAVLAILAAACALVNYERWGNPLTFADLRLHFAYQYIFPERLVVLAEHGEFNPARIGYGLLYYFLPLWVIRGADGGFLFDGFERRFLDSVELPPGSLLVSDPLIVGLAIVGIVLAWRRRAGIDVPAIGLTALGLTLPILLILMAIGMTFRYRGEFYPLLQFLACIGFFLACTVPTPHVADAPASLRALALAGCAAGVLGSHLLLVLYDLSPLGPARDLVHGRSIVGFYGEKFRLLTGGTARSGSAPEKP